MVTVEGRVGGQKAWRVIGSAGGQERGEIYLNRGAVGLCS